VAGRHRHRRLTLTDRGVSSRNMAGLRRCAATGGTATRADLHHGPASRSPVARTGAVLVVTLLWTLLRNAIIPERACAVSLDSTRTKQ
jgi:hypothetical protein